MHCGGFQVGVKLVAKAQSQVDKFKQAARDLDADEDEAHWDERLKKIAKAKPEEKPR